MYGTDSHWEIITSSGRRVSLLCEDDVEHSYSSSSSISTPSPPLSPDHRSLVFRPHRTNSLESTSSSSSSIRSLSPPSPPNLSLPPLERLLPVQETAFFPRLPVRPRISSISTPPPVSPIRTAIEGGYSPTAPSSIATISNPPSPKSSSPTTPVIKRSSRRYTCQCGKSFTTSGHLARHTRIHTGEKNYICPESGCGARFSRQDNCMQHYRTHQSGTASKRASRRRRMSTDSSISGTSASHHEPESSPVNLPLSALSYHPPAPLQLPQLTEPFRAESGLAALATIAIAAYPEC